MRESSWEKLRLSDDLRNWFKLCKELILLSPNEDDTHLAFASLIKDKDFSSKDHLIQINEVIRYRNQIALKHLGLISLAAFDFDYRLKDDLLQEGFFGLVRAIEKFDHRLGYQFSTYALFWIKQSIQRYLANRGATIRVPVHAPQVLKEAASFESAFLTKRGRCPSPEEVSEGTRFKALTLATLVKPVFTPDDQLKLIENDSLKPTCEILEDFQEKEQISKAIKQLAPREQQIINYRFGFAAFKEKSLQELGKI